MFKILSIFIIFSFLHSFDPMLLKIYKGDENLTNWLMSEKLDGIRGLWDGKNLKSRTQKILNPPKIWLKCFPKFSLDGEIYANNLIFEEITSIVNSYEDKGWDKLKFYIFDAPDLKGNFITRMKKLKEILEKNPCKNLVIIKQIPALNHQNVQKFLDEVTKKGGEGVVLRDKFGFYESRRSDKILKLKKFLDDECKVIKINLGQGKYKNLMGSLTCQNLKNGKIFKIGSGFSDKIRKNPPKIGEILTYKYQNLTKTGIPRFPVFLRKKENL